MVGRGWIDCGWLLLERGKGEEVGVQGWILLLSRGRKFDGIIIVDYEVEEIYEYQ